MGFLAWKAADSAVGIAVVRSDEGFGLAWCGPGLWLKSAFLGLEGGEFGNEMVDAVDADGMAVGVSGS